MQRHTNEIHFIEKKREKMSITTGQSKISVTYTPCVLVYTMLRYTHVAILAESEGPRPQLSCSCADNHMSACVCVYAQCTLDDHKLNIGHSSEWVSPPWVNEHK